MSTPAALQLIKAHLDAAEEILLCQSKIVNAAGHSLHKGLAREVFVRDFLGKHLAESLGVGTGEIFDYERVVGDSANQIDVVIYDRSYPKLEFAEGAAAFLIDSVRATIKVKSVLDEAGIEQVAKVSENIKSLKKKADDQNKDQALIRVSSYLVAYRCNASLETVFGWIRKHDTSYNIDGVFILGTGFILGVWPRRFLLHDSDASGATWVYSEANSGGLYALYFLLNFAVLGVSIKQYFKNVLESYQLRDWQGKTVAT